jgi:hypothetical protein
MRAMMQHMAENELRGKWEWLRHWFFFSSIFVSEFHQFSLLE